MEFLFKTPPDNDFFKGVPGYTKIMKTGKNPFFFSQRRLKKIILEESPDVINYFDSIGLKYYLMRVSNGDVYALFFDKEDLDLLKLVCDVKYDTSFDEYRKEFDDAWNDKSLSPSKFKMSLDLSFQKLIMNSLYGHLRENTIWDRTL